MKNKTSYRAIGLMSGTSLDGLDIALCTFTKRGTWRCKILAASTVRYSRSWKAKLTTAPFLSGEALLALHTEYGRFLGQQCSEFITNLRIRNIDLIASHGHTIFHQTSKKFTFQLGDGNAIASEIGFPVVYDFRSFDVALNGQGAPLVPVGDRHLFSDYDVCLNIGGIANLSMEQRGSRVAFDICFANMGLNCLSAEAGKDFDRDGKIATRGTVNKALLGRLNDQYRRMKTNRPALGREGFEKMIQPLLENKRILLADRMRTFCESIADEIAGAIPDAKKNLRVLATGGGALNPFLVKLTRQKLEGRAKVEIPPRQIVEFKEAMVFAFLGVLRMRGEVNVLKSVTRAVRDSCSGVVVGV